MKTLSINDNITIKRLNQRVVITETSANYYSRTYVKIYQHCFQIVKRIERIKNTDKQFSKEYFYAFYSLDFLKALQSIN